MPVLHFYSLFSSQLPYSAFILIHLDNVKVLFDKLIDERLKHILWCTLIFIFPDFYSPQLQLILLRMSRNKMLCELVRLYIDCKKILTLVIFLYYILYHHRNEIIYDINL